MIRNADLFKIRKGLDLLNGVKSFDLGVLRGRIAHIINPEIEAINEGLNNPEFEKFRQSLMGMSSEELAKAEVANRHLFEERRKQVEDSEKYLKEEYKKNNIPRIPASLLPKDVASEAIEMLFPILDFEEKQPKPNKK